MGTWQHESEKLFLSPWNNLISQWLIDILPEVRQNISLLSHRLLAKSEADWSLSASLKSWFPSYFALLQFQFCGELGESPLTPGLFVDLLPLENLFSLKVIKLKTSNMNTINKSRASLFMWSVLMMLFLTWVKINLIDILHGKTPLM